VEPVNSGYGNWKSAINHFLTFFGETVPRFDKAGRGGFMRRFLTLVCLLCLALPAGISISGCYRNPSGNFCNGLGYGMKDTDVASITLSPATTGISMAFGQTRQVSSPSALTCKGAAASVSSYTYGTTNNQLVDISPSGNLCAGTWNRNTGGGIANYTICYAPDPKLLTNGLPYSTAYITASADAVTSNPVEVFVHAQVTSISLVGPTSCLSQTQTAQLDAQACYAGGNNQQVLMCAPASVTSANSACAMPAITPDIIASGHFVSATGNAGVILNADYASGGSIAGTAGQTCTLSSFNNGSTGATATVALTSANTIAGGTPLTMTAGGTGATSAPTTATLSSGTATCSGTANVTSLLGPIAGAAGQTCSLSNFNNGSTGATATVTLTSANQVANGTPLAIVAGGLGATAPPTTATLSNGTATCSGTATVVSTMTPVPTCTNAIGTLSYTVGNSAIATINSETNQITANLPGTTAITASVNGSGSSAGFFSTCPPQSISVTLENGHVAGTITQGSTPQNLVTTVTDTNGNTITGLTLDYQSTDPIDISAGSSGTVSANFPGEASIYAICQPTTCNPAPINEVGFNGTGLSISSNPVTVTTPGTASDYVYFASPGQSQYFVPIDLLNGTEGSTVRMPYVPNSMVMDRTGNSLYFGSQHGLMVFSTTSSSLTKQDTSVPGVVLAVSPNNASVLINDQVRQLFYLYNASGGSSTTFGGLGSAASWTPDSKTLYVTDSAALNLTPENVAAKITGHTDTLYVYNANTGWTTYPLACSVYDEKTCPSPTIGAQSLAVTIPGVGAYLSGSATTAHTWCPTGTVGNYASMSFYPQSDSVPTPTDVLAATVDGQHILGATLTGGAVTLADIGVKIPTTESAGIATPIACPITTNISTGVQTLSALSTNPTLNALLSLTKVTGATAVNQVIPSPKSNLAFITYSGATGGATLPYYQPVSGGAAGSLNYVTLSDCAATDPSYPCNSTILAPLAGVFTPDDQLFFVSTAGDNMIHYISVPTLTDTQQISPALPACTPVSAGGNDSGCIYSGTGTIVPTTALVVKPRSTT
jgi:hypothetical protein